jgi:hypothetical protein
MHDDIRVEKIIETIYMEIADHVTDEICLTCPLVRSIRDLKDNIKDANHDKIVQELGLSFSGDFPCLKKSN